MVIKIVLFFYFISWFGCVVYRSVSKRLDILLLVFFTVIWLMSILLFTSVVTLFYLIFRFLICMFVFMSKSFQFSIVFFCFLFSFFVPRSTCFRRTGYMYLGTFQNCSFIQFYSGHIYNLYIIKLWSTFYTFWIHNLKELMSNTDV